MAKKECPNCKNILEDDDLFCQKCGTKIEKKEENHKNMLICPNCKQKTNKNNKFCDKCGSMIIIEENKKVKEKKDSTHKCPKCNNPIKENDSFCMNCGNKLSNEIEIKSETNIIDERKCNNCNEKLEKNDVFCPKCGTRNDLMGGTNNIEQNSINNYPPKKKSSNFLIIITIFLLLVIIIMLLIILLTKGNEKENTEAKDKDKEEIVEKKKEENKENQENKEVTIYYDNVNGKYTTEETATARKLGAIKTTEENIEIYDGVALYTPEWEIDGAIILYKDSDKIKINNTRENKSKTIDIKSTYDKYKIVTDKENNAIGIEYLDDVNVTTDRYGYETMNSFATSGFYNIDKNKIVYEDEDYYDFAYITKNRISAKKGFNSNKKIYLLGTNEEKIYLSNNQAGTYDECGSITYTGLGDYFIIEGEADCLDGNIGSGNVYSENINLIESNISSSMIEVYEDNLYIFKNNIIYKYNKDGREIYKSSEYEKILDVIQNYFVIIENGKIKLKNESNLDLTIGDWKSTYQYHSMISGYYSEGQLSNENEKDAGIYLIVQTDENGYSSGVEYYINTTTHEIKKYELKEIGGYAKPVLYLYPEKETNVTVSFEHKNNLTTTYPKFNNEWQVLVKPNGDLYDENGKYYYGLYWEENSNHTVDFSTGFYVEKDDAIEFLEEKLSIIGLNDRERNEFIMYWLPILEKNEKSLVYFELTEERDNYNKLIINPTPDSILRVAIHVKKVNNKTDIKEEKLTTFKRIGFTAVEWGGVVYN